MLIHDGVRPLIDSNLIKNNINSVLEYGTAISCANTTETFIVQDKVNVVKEVPQRKDSMCAKAPQSFYLDEILSIHEKAIQDKHIDVVDTCTLMHMYAKKMHVVECSSINIKITTPADFEIFCALKDYYK